MSKQYFVELITKVNRHAHACLAFVKFCKRVRLLRFCNRALNIKLLTCYNLTDIDQLVSLEVTSCCTRKILHCTVFGIRYHIPTT